MKVSVVIPAYNAGRTLAGVIGRIPEDLYAALDRIWIVNDGSLDDTAALADSLAGRHQVVRAIHLERNRGYGGAMKRGLDAALKDGAEVVACLHADGQYAPESLPELLDVRDRRGLDILQGSRLARGTALSGGMPLYKYLAGRALVVIENLVFGLGLTDYHSGYMLYGRRALERIPYHRLSDSFDFDLEMIASARARGLAIGEWPIPTSYTDEISHLKPVAYGIKVLGVLWGYRRGRYDGSTSSD
ncbi:MAG TPA: glycosyltransferase family 2 protein [Myxococcota bacterium]|nr:glycosyltransferase family 2 protein [Myxococcota bacterium]